MTRRHCLGPSCTVLLPAPGADGGRPRLYCGERCRSAHRRLAARIDRGLLNRAETADATEEALHKLRSAVYSVAAEARHMAQALDPQAARQPRDRQEGGPAATATLAALGLVEAAHSALTAAVEADRAAGSGWSAIGVALDVSEDTAARRYRPR
ncbi:hypothetical protein ACIP3B_36240 [Streptomyces anulatus]|uniref:hypothetical protein n=1 Tax=Streptomyces anulatus TaxID=1892 RepID=UPI00340AFCBF